MCNAVSDITQSRNSAPSFDFCFCFSARGRFFARLSSLRIVDDRINHGVLVAHRRFSKTSSHSTFRCCAINFVDESGSSESEAGIHSLDFSLDCGSGSIQPKLPSGAYRYVSFCVPRAFIASASFRGCTGCVPNALFFICRLLTSYRLHFMPSAAK